jgi:hypothetical protein
MNRNSSHLQIRQVESNRPAPGYNELRLEILKKIRESRYLAAKAVNRELLCLYFFIGGLISKRISQYAWGSKVLLVLSEDIQKDIPGIRGFSERNLKNMRRFYEHFAASEFRQLLTAQMDNAVIRA